MGFRHFIKPNKQKLVLAFFMFFFAPLPIFVVFAFISLPGFVMPAGLILRGLFVEGIDNILGGILIGVLNASVVYFVSCVIYWIVNRFTTKEKTLWMVISIIILFFLILSIFKVYAMHGMEGSKSYNWIELFEILT
jgi:hypothetical protein